MEGEAQEIIEMFTRWNTAEAERDGIKNAIIHVKQIIQILDNLNQNTEKYQKILKEIKEICKML